MVRLGVAMFGRSIGESLGGERIGEFTCSNHTYRSRGDASSHASFECLLRLGSFLPTRLDGTRWF